jgi:hypothetical protein
MERQIFTEAQLKHGLRGKEFTGEKKRKWLK